MNWKTLGVFRPTRGLILWVLCRTWIQGRAVEMIDAQLNFQM